MKATIDIVQQMNFYDTIIKETAAAAEFWRPWDIDKAKHFAMLSSEATEMYNQYDMDRRNLEYS